MSIRTGSSSPCVELVDPDADADGDPPAPRLTTLRFITGRLFGLGHLACPRTNPLKMAHSSFHCSKVFDWIARRVIAKLFAMV